MTKLVARTRLIERDVDLLGFAGGEGLLFARNGAGLAGRGVALRVGRDEAPAALAAIVRDDEVGRPGTGALAFGSLPFLPGAAATLVVPSIVVGRATDGTRWVTTIGPDGQQPQPDLTPADPPVPSGGGFTLRPSLSPQEWMGIVAEGVARIRSGALGKVVLAREVVVDADQPIDRHAVLTRLRASFGSSHLYAVDGFVGASPELLVSRHDHQVRSHPLAGTAPRTGDPATDARLAAGLLASAKDQGEHRITIAMVHDTLLPWCSWLDWEAEPSIVTVANVQHLGSMVEGRLSSPPPNVLTLVDALQPTPALGGHPRDEAVALIAEIERLDRGPYGGAVGWVDADGNGEWAVAIRCARIDGNRARLYAGNGIVAGSDPALELAETQAKFQAMLSALIRP